MCDQCDKLEEKFSHYRLLPSQRFDALTEDKGVDRRFGAAKRDDALLAVLFSARPKFLRYSLSWQPYQSQALRCRLSEG
jgi:hypothetical protein